MKWLLVFGVFVVQSETKGSRCYIGVYARPSCCATKRPAEARFDDHRGTHTHTTRRDEEHRGACSMVAEFQGEDLLLALGIVCHTCMSNRRASRGVLLFA